jgi:hypothetical protein
MNDGRDLKGIEIWDFKFLLSEQLNIHPLFYYVSALVGMESFFLLILFCITKLGGGASSGKIYTVIHFDR